MVGVDFIDDRLDAGIGLDHGRVQLVLESLPTGLVRIARRRARFMRCLQGVCFGLEARISRKRRFAGRFQFLFLVVGQEAHAVMAAGRRGGVVRFRE